MSIDVSIPRKMLWSTDVDGLSYCPECQAPLKSEYHSYLVGVRRRREVELFTVGSDAGYFCTQCPVVVLDRDKFEELVSIGAGRSNRIEFTAVGIIDLEAVPESKQDMPLGTDENPLPLVQFTNVDIDDGQENKHPASRARHRTQRKTKRNRNKPKAKKKRKRRK